MITRVVSSSVTVRRPGSGSSTTSTISVSTCGVGADDRFFLLARVFAVLGRALLTGLFPAALEDFFAFLDTGRFAGLLPDTFPVFPRLDALGPARLFRLAIASPLRVAASPETILRPQGKPSSRLFWSVQGV